MHTIGKFITAGLTAAVVLAMSAVAIVAASQFEGKWNVADTAGKAFEITLAGDGSAKANRDAEGMTGTWKEEGSAAVITWDTGWTTKISKDGNKYTKKSESDVVRSAAGWTVRLNPRWVE